MKVCVVTGATGVVGGALLRALGSEWRVHALSHGGARPALRGVEWITADLADVWSTDRLPPRADAVVHLAQTPAFHHFPECADEIFRVGVDSAMRLLEYGRSAGARTFLLGSSGGVYGAAAAPVAEDASVPLCAKQAFFLRCKAAAEQLAAGYRGVMDVVVVRFFFVYGPGQRRAMLLPRLVDAVASGRPVTLLGPDGLHLNPMHASDCGAALARALSLGGSHVLNLGGPEVLSLRRIAQIIGRAVGREPVFRVEPADRPVYLAGSVERASALLGAPRVRFEQGVADLLPPC